MAAGKRGKRRAVIPGLEHHHGKWRWSRMVDGVRTRVPLLADSEEAAVSEVIAIRNRPQVLGDWENAVEAYFRARTAGKRLGARTIDSRRPILLAIGPALGIESPRNITPVLAEKWTMELVARTDLSERTKHDYFGYFRAFCAWCVESGRMLRDPLAGIVGPPNPKTKRHRFLPAEEAAKLLQAARAAGDRDMEFILTFGFECGMRRGEIGACRPEWFDLRNGVVIIPAIERAATDTERDWKRKSKEGREREAVVPLSEVVLELIKRHSLPTPFVVAPQIGWGKGFYRYDFRKRYYSFLAANGIANLTIHDMRRSFASNKVSAGVSIEKVANWMGITAVVAWENYSRFLPGDPEINKGSAVQPSTVQPSTLPETATPLTGYQDMAARLTRLDDLLATGLISADERVSARAAILAAV